MSSVTVTRFRENIFEYIKSAVEFNEVIDVTTKDGNAVVMSKDDYEAMQETLYLLSAKGMKERLEQALTAKPEDCVPLSEVWPDV
jgi:prevent-host-death family protein